MVRRGDVERGRHQRRVAAHQRDAGRRGGDVGAGRHRDAEIGRGQRRRVVHAVAHHRHRRRARAGAATSAALSAGSASARTSSMPSARRGRVGRAPAVAGQQHDPHAAPRAAAPPRPRRRASARRRTRAGPARRPRRVSARKDTVRPSALPARRRPRNAPRRPRRLRASAARLPSSRRRPSTTPSMPRPGSARTLGAAGETAGPPRASDGAGQRMLAARLQRGGQAQQLGSARRPAPACTATRPAGPRSACRSCRTPRCGSRARCSSAAGRGSGCRAARRRRCRP